MSLPEQLTDTDTGDIERVFGIEFVRGLDENVAKQIESEIANGKRK